MGGVSLHVRTCTSRFCISGTARPIVFKFGMWVGGHQVQSLLIVAIHGVRQPGELDRASPCSLRAPATLTGSAAPLRPARAGRGERPPPSPPLPHRPRRQLLVRVPGRMRVRDHAGGSNQCIAADTHETERFP